MSAPPGEPRPYRYKHVYRDLGPSPETTYAHVEYAGRLRDVSRLLRELHAAADYPKSRVMAEAIGTSGTLVTRLLSGRVLPTWPVVRALGVLLAELSGSNPATVERALYRLFTTVPRNEESKDRE